jgi:hypothetical protein
MAVVADVVNEEEDVFWTSTAAQKGTVLAHRDRLPDGAKIAGSRRCPEEAVSDRVRSVPEGRRPGCFWMRRSIRHRSARLWGVNLSGPKPARYCRFCGESENDVGRLLTNGGAVLPENTICDGCVRIFAEIIGERASPAPKAEPFCTFCGKDKSEVRKLIASESHVSDRRSDGLPRVPPRRLPQVAICNECIDLSNAIIGSNSPKG